MADQQAEHLLFANPLGDLRLESAHEHVELICRFAVGKIGNLAGRGDQDALNHRPLFVKSPVELVLLGLRLGERLDGISPLRLGSRTKKQNSNQAD